MKSASCYNAEIWAHTLFSCEDAVAASVRKKLRARNTIKSGNCSLWYDVGQAKEKELAELTCPVRVGSTRTTDAQMATTELSADKPTNIIAGRTHQQDHARPTLHKTRASTTVLMTDLRITARLPGSTKLAPVRLQHKNSVSLSKSVVRLAAAHKLTQWSASSWKEKSTTVSFLAPAPP